jgi:hypothetical protein
LPNALAKETRSSPHRAGKPNPHAHDLYIVSRRTWLDGNTLSIALPAQE